MSTAKPAKKADGKKPPARSRRVGALIKAREVVRPDGVTVDVSGGVYVLDVVGTFTVDGHPVEVIAR